MRCVGRGSRASRVATAVVGVLGLWLLVPSTPAMARSEFFGIVQGPTLDGRDLQGMASARVRTSRFVLKWGWVQPRRGYFDWRSADAFIGALASRGIRVVPALWGNPPWVYGSPARPPLDRPEAVLAWRTFLRALVARYGAGGSYWRNGYRQRFGADANPLPIHSWQIWNEPNLHKYFAPIPSARTYARLLTISHDAIQSRDPHARIVLAGMPGHGDVKAWDFLNRLYAVPGIKNKFDAAALHPYASNLLRHRQQIERFRAVMRNRLDQATPLWLTELGWGSAPPDRFGINKGLAGQAQLLSDSLRLVLSRRQAWNVERLFWFHWRDPSPFQASGCSFCGSSGLLRYGNTPKPALRAFRGFTAERTPPQVSITGGPGAGSSTKDPTPRFSLASNEAGSTFVCRLDTRPVRPCGSPYTTPPLSDGTHNILVKAIDAPGNVSRPVSRRFAIDTDVPAVTMTSGPAPGSTTPDRSTSFSFASNESGVRFSCQLDGRGFGSCSSPSTASGLADAPHTFQVRAADRAGNKSPTVTRTWTVDGPADVSITTGPQNGEVTSDPTPRFAFSSTDSGVTFSCRLDDAAFAPCASPLTVSTLSEGDHRFTVRATDAAQNTALASRAFTVDTTAPGATIASGPVDSTVNDPTPTFELSATEPGATFECRYAGQGFSACSGARSHTPAAPLEDGAHALWVRAIDRAGNRGDGLDVRFRVDTVAPKLEIEGPSRTRTDRERLAVAFGLKASEQVRLRCRTDSGSFRACSERYRTPKLRPGTHTLRVKGTDRAGNFYLGSKQFKIKRQLGKEVSLTAPTAPSSPRCHGVAATLIGSPHADRLRGTSGPDVIVAFGGDDKINGRGGRDRICARRGDDRVTAGWGDDRVLGGPGSDHLRGGAGRDMIRGATGVDRCWGVPAPRRFHCDGGG
jgi:hypothetical protein